MREGATLLAASLLMGCGPPPKPALLPPVTVVGRLVDQVSGQAIAGEVLQLRTHCHGCETYSIVEATTADDGGFRFEGVPMGSNGQPSCYLSHLTAPDADRKDDKSWLSTSILDPSVVYRKTSGKFDLYKDPPGWKDKDTVYIQATGPIVDVGPVLHFDGKVASAAFAPVCETGKPGTVPVLGFAVMMKGDKKGPWKYDDLLHLKLAKKWKPPSPVYLCIHASYEKIGEYLSSTSSKREPAMRVNWDVRLIDARDGKKVEKESFSMDPPLSTTEHKTYGDPTPDLVDWLAKRQPPEA